KNRNKINIYDIMKSTTCSTLCPTLGNQLLTNIENDSWDESKALVEKIII
ncbi:unnamed protein product, partial [Rotaria magnacalcarata]